MNRIAQILPVREQDRIISDFLSERLETILPQAMREAQIDMWLILCQEDDLDPVFRTMIPMNTWTPILQMLIFFDRGSDQRVERINLSMTDTGEFYDKPWNGRNCEEQWDILRDIIQKRDPQKIGINIGHVNWATGGLTHNLYHQLVRTLPTKYCERLTSAETASTKWLMTLSPKELEIYPHIVSIAHQFIEYCYSPKSIIPGYTTTDDLEWTYWQLCNDHGLELSFKPYFRIARRLADQEKSPEGDKTIRRGDVIHCDVGFRYLRLCTDHQEVAYVLREGEKDVPEGLKHILAENNRLQAIYLQSFEKGLNGNQLLEKILTRAKAENIPAPKVYSHSLGLFLHEPGPLIGLPWEQENCPGRGDVKLDYNSCFTMELSIEDQVSELGNQLVRIGTEQDVKFTRNGCVPMDGVQTEFHLVR